MLALVPPYSAGPVVRPYVNPSIVVWSTVVITK